MRIEWTVNGKPLKTGIKSISTHTSSLNRRVHIFTRDEIGLVYLPTQLERTLQL
jgi:hypothetical protein